MSKSISERINVDGRGCEWTNRHEWKDADNSCPASGKPATALMKDSVQTALSDHACLRDAVLEGKMKVLVAQSVRLFGIFQARIPVFLPREFHGQRSLAGCSPWGHKESGMTEQPTLSLSSKNTGMGCHSLLQEIFLTQRSNLGLLHYRQILYHWASQEGSWKNVARLKSPWKWNRMNEPSR